MKVCEHCREGFALASTGRPPKYCSSTCRKAAFDKRKLDEAVVAAVARAVAAERRRSNRGNETRRVPDIRGNETPGPARPAVPPVPALSPRPAVPPARPTMPTPDMSKPRRERGSLFPSFRAKPPRQSSLFDDQEQPDEQPETDPR
ncbi:hypothetical protein GCM10010271_74120 [Streptomyces kurssanovii]|nr:hypothetical protein GCM10010271_74120 [Streptomyces kurssanovii]